MFFDIAVPVYCKYLVIDLAFWDAILDYNRHISLNNKIVFYTKDGNKKYFEVFLYQMLSFCKFRIIRRFVLHYYCSSHNMKW